MNSADRANDTCAGASVDDWRSAPDSLAGGSAAQRAMDHAADALADHFYAAAADALERTSPPSQPSPVPASPKDDVASPSAAQTVAQAAVEHWEQRGAPEHAMAFCPRDVAVKSAFEAGAAWMRERALQAAPCDVCRWEKTLHVGARFADHEWMNGWLTALCASYAEKGEPG